MKPQKFEFSDLVDDYVIWKPNTNLVSMIEEEIQSNGFYDLDLDVKRSENRDGNLIAVFLLENHETYCLIGGIKVIKDSRINTKITSIEKVEIVRSSQRCFKLNEQYSDSTKEIYERVKYPLFTSKPPKWAYEKYIRKAIQENRELEASIGKREITLTTKYCILFCYLEDIYDYVMQAIQKEGRYFFPGSVDIRRTSKVGDVLQSVTILLECGEQYYLVSPEYGTKKGEFAVYIKDLEPVVLEESASSRYRRIEVHHYHLIPKESNPYFNGDEASMYYKYKVLQRSFWKL